MKDSKIRYKKLKIFMISAFMALSTFAVASFLVSAQDTENYFFTLSLKAPQGNEIRMQVGALLPAELAKIGINVELEYQDFASLIDDMIASATTGATAADGGMDIWLVGFGVDSVDPGGFISWFDSNYFSPEGNNYWNFQNAEVDRLLEEAGQLVDQDDRQPLYWEVLEIVKDQAFTIEMYTPTQYGMKLATLENADGWVAAYDNWLSRYWTIAGKTEADDTSVVIAITTDFRNVIESLSEVTYDRYLHHLMFDSLIAHERTIVDPKYYGPEPNLATSWTVSEDGLTYTFQLRNDVKWHDGAPFTSNDVKFTYDALLDPETAAADSQYWRENVEDIETPDDYTVVVNLKNRFPGAWELLFRRNIMPEHILGDVPHADWLTSAYNTGQELLPGTGPYKMVEWNRDEYVELEAYDDYHMGRPFIDEYYIRIIPDASVGIAALEAGEVDLLTANYGLVTEYERLSADSNIDIEIGTSNSNQQLQINTAHPILSNVWVRRAISHAIPREHIVDDLALGWAEPATQFIPEIRSWAFNPNLEATTYDLDLAREYMEKAGFDYEWLETPAETPITTNYTPILLGIVVGIVIGAGAIYFLRRQ